MLRIFLQILRGFLCNSRTPVLKTSKCQRKSMKACAQRELKLCTENLHISAQKMRIDRISATAIPRIGVKIPSLWKMKARKKNKNNLHQTCAEPQALYEKAWPSGFPRCSICRCGAALPQHASPRNGVPPTLCLQSACVAR